jgi:hypothetical protein
MPRGVAPAASCLACGVRRRGIVLTGCRGTRVARPTTGSARDWRWKGRRSRELAPSGAYLRGGRLASLLSTHARATARSDSESGPTIRPSTRSSLPGATSPSDLVSADRDRSTFETVESRIAGARLVHSAARLGAGNRSRVRRQNRTSKSITGTSISTPTTVASAALLADSLHDQVCAIRGCPRSGVESVQPAETANTTMNPKTIAIAAKDTVARPRFQPVKTRLAVTTAPIACRA